VSLKAFWLKIYEHQIIVVFKSLLYRAFHKTMAEFRLLDDDAKIISPQHFDRDDINLRNALYVHILTVNYED